MLRLISRQYVRPIRQVGATEQVIGIGILVLAFGVVAAFVVDVSSVSEPSFGIAADAYATAPTERLEPEVAAAAQIPVAVPNPWTTVSLDGWKAPQWASRYTAENLYVKINGRAPVYLEAEFVALTFGSYAHESIPQRSISVYCYEMSNAANATAIYDAEAPPNAEAIRIGDAAYQTGGAVFFRKGRFYGQLLPTQTGEAEGRAARRLGQMLDAWLEAHAPASAPPLSIRRAPGMKTNDNG